MMARVMWITIAAEGQSSVRCVLVREIGQHLRYYSDIIDRFSLSPLFPSLLPLSLGMNRPSYITDEYYALRYSDVHVQECDDTWKYKLLHMHRIGRFSYITMKISTKTSRKESFDILSCNIMASHRIIAFGSKIIVPKILINDVYFRRNNRIALSTPRSSDYRADQRAQSGLAIV